MATTENDLLSIPEQVLRANRFLTVATSGKDNTPWAAPLMYAIDKHDRFYWVSASDAIHSRHIAENPNVAIVIFDSNPAYGSAQGLYCSAVAQELAGDDLRFGCEVFYRMRYPNDEERTKKGRAPRDFEGASPRRMYLAKVLEFSILHPSKHPTYGALIDYRVVVPFHTHGVGIL